MLNRFYQVRLLREAQKPYIAAKNLKNINTFNVQLEHCIESFIQKTNAMRTALNQDELNSLHRLFFFLQNTIRSFYSRAIYDADLETSMALEAYLGFLVSVHKGIPNACLLQPEEYQESKASMINALNNSKPHELFELNEAFNKSKNRTFVHQVLGVLAGLIYALPGLVASFHSLYLSVKSNQSSTHGILTEHLNIISDYMEEGYQNVVDSPKYNVATRAQDLHTNIFNQNHYRLFFSKIISEEKRNEDQLFEAKHTR